MNKLGELIIRHADEYRADLLSRTKRLEAEKAKLQREIHKLIRMRTQGLLTDKEFLLQKSMLTEERTLYKSRRLRQTVQRSRKYDTTQNE